MQRGMITMFTEKCGPGKIGSWHEAIRRNFALNSGDRVHPFNVMTEHGKYLETIRLAYTADGGRLTPEQKRGIDPFIGFIQAQQLMRKLPGVEEDWRTNISSIKPPREELCSPRFGDMIYKFRGEFGRLFKGLRVLDIGCITEEFDRLPSLRFYRYYRNFGAQTVGIDLFAKNDPEEGIRQGDARFLDFADRSYDFITLPMIYGLANPAETVLETVSGLSELHRVLDNGLIHIADTSLRPGLIYIANRLGFRYFYNSLRPGDWKWNGLPLGSLLIKRNTPLEGNPFKDILFEHLAAQEIRFNDTGTDEIPTNRKLYLREPD